MEVPELRSACQNYITTTTAQPKRIEEEELAPSVNIDSALKKASQADNADEEDRIRVETKMSLDQCLRSNLQLYVLESSTYNSHNLSAAWRDSTFGAAEISQDFVYFVSITMSCARFRT